MVTLLARTIFLMVLEVSDGHRSLMALDNGGKIQLWASLSSGYSITTSTLHEFCANSGILHCSG